MWGECEGGDMLVVEFKFEFEFEASVGVRHFSRVLQVSLVYIRDTVLPVAALGAMIYTQSVHTQLDTLTLVHTHTHTSICVMLVGLL